VVGYQEEQIARTMRNYFVTICFIFVDIFSKKPELSLRRSIDTTLPFPSHRTAPAAWLENATASEASSGIEDPAILLKIT
jgi:hypothetical protein